MRTFLHIIVGLTLIAACSGENGSSQTDVGAGVDAGSSADGGVSGTDAADASEEPDLYVPEPGEPVMVHNFGTTQLDGGEETEPCAQWTFENSKPLYVNKVTMSNDGAFHHSNWLVVPETSFPGEDGFFDCEARGYDEVTAAVQGTVLVAQSTQSLEEVQDLPDGIAIKIPPFSKVIGGLHMLNLSTKPRETSVRMRLDLLHPADVETIVTPFRLSYFDLHIEPEAETRVASTCDIAAPYEDFTGDPLDIKLYWVLPHYHELGNYFRLDVVGGPMDVQNLFELEGFNAEANGQAFDPPIDLTGATGLRFSCGFNNPRPEEVGWGIGDQEMCVMLGLVDAGAIFDAGVAEGNEVVGTDAEGRSLHEGPCQVTMLPKNANQAMPSPEEVEAPLYVPPSDEEPGEVTVVPECEDAPAAEPAKFAAKLSTIQNSIFIPSCSYSACHGSTNPAFGLDLKSDGLHDRLLTHEVQTDTDLPLVAPGDADGSWLYQIMSKCEPSTNEGTVAHMPRNSPNLLEPGLVGMVREWIGDGATNN